MGEGPPSAPTVCPGQGGAAWGMEVACGGQATHRPGGRRGEGGLGRWGSQRVQQSVERMAGMGAAAAVSHFLPHIHGAPVPTSVVPPPPDLASALNPSPREWVLRGGLCPSPCPRHSSPRSPCLPHLQGRCGDPQARPRAHLAEPEASGKQLRGHPQAAPPRRTRALTVQRRGRCWARSPRIPARPLGPAPWGEATAAKQGPWVGSGLRFGRL